MDSPPTEREKLLVERLDWLASARERHRKSQRRSPLYLLLAVLVVPGALLGGLPLALAAVIVAIAFFSLSFYVAWNHEMECDAEADSIRKVLSGAVGLEAVAPTQAQNVRVVPAPTDEGRAKFDRVRQPRRHSL